jgi:hypothetical protein
MIRCSSPYCPRAATVITGGESWCDECLAAMKIVKDEQRKTLQTALRAAYEADKASRRWWWPW